MFAFAGINIVAVSICFLLFPEELNEVVEKDDSMSVDAESDTSLITRNNRELSWAMILSIKENVFAMSSLVLMTFTIFFYQAWLSTYLVSIPGFSESWVGVVISIPSFVSLLGFWLFPIYFEKSPRKLMFLFGHLGFVITCLCLGPSKMLNFPVHPSLILTAMPLMGIFQVFVYLPVMPELIERT